ncbi:hypothetical protein NSS89_01310 [Caldifermentibacillus hisashii]|uniref:hypothetical protein n=1 Tax=Caldifermentibacillus hisashii TaxID=996558 RepID=UPI0031FE0B49
MTDKERLEEIKEAYRWTIDNSLVPRLSDSDTEWLIEQAERVQEVEEELKELRAMYSVVNGERIRYKQALEFYADEEHYKDKQISEALCDADGVYISNDEYLPSIIYLDKGKTARKALEESCDDYEVT